MRRLLFVFVFLQVMIGFGQEIPVNQTSSNSFTFQTKKQNQVLPHSFAFSYSDHNIVGGETEVTVKALGEEGELIKGLTGSYTFTYNGKTELVKFENGKAHFLLSITSEVMEVGLPNGKRKNLEFDLISGWMTIIPPLVAILFALISRQVLLSLFLGILSGTFILNGLNLHSFFLVIEKYGMNALNDSGHMSIIVFSTIIGGMVAIISKNGGMAGVVNVLSKYATSKRSAQLITWFLGVAIFFDDYANTLVVGNTMKSVTDKFRISREKLAYLVDSTAAPVASIAFITTWIGAELGYIDDATSALGIEEGAYSIFIGSLKYAFYPVFTLVFMLIIIWSQKDIGPMRVAEEKADQGAGAKEDVKVAESEEFEPVNLDKIRWYNAFIPVSILIVTVFAGLWITGTEATPHSELEGLSFLRKLGVIIGNSDSYVALLWASLASVTAAIALTVSQKIMNLEETMNSALGGFKSMTTSMIILISAWALASITEDLHTADYLTSLFTDNLSEKWVPSITFLLAGAVAFSTGSSWGTMAILYPLMLPATWSICQASGLAYEESMEVMYHVTAVVLAGSVFGDHCSPISDTTILSSLASGCNHIEHVRTQMPYAAITGAVSVFASIVLINVGLHWSLAYLIGIGVLTQVVRIFGR